MADRMTLCLTGDVMTGRGIDQILRHPGHPMIFERWMGSALGYVELAERRVGQIPRYVEPEYIWGDALEVLRRAAPDALIVNLETAVTDQGTPWPDKAIQYRMHPANIEVLPVAGVDVAVLANNHVLDWSLRGFEQTLDAVRGAGVATVGAGRDLEEAWAPAGVPAAGGRVLVLAAGMLSSGVPWDWAADVGRPGVALLTELTDRAVERIAAVVASAVQPGDVVVMSIHWGPNWGYEIRPEHQRFARALIDRAGVHVVHGHSSHHPLGIEVHQGGLILYGCGDLITDYEGISGHEHYRGELGALYLPTLDTRTGKLERLEVAPTKMERFRLNRPSPPDLEWLASMLQRECSPLGTTVNREGDTLLVGW